jgi:hypothetical protein
MVYTCAYFESADTDLDCAQERKLDHICRKLRLRPGERLLATFHRSQQQQEHKAFPDALKS